ncbi:uncharacterized protein G2W53_019789 [Senna tora]|uniref:Uncharacterized protein n=1 Tax=Senna tora TaxID=362788 RepID=A0A834TYT6_9FABA|nr:uncharacterized protein G2W53_019789 [Senna tora]
MTRLPTSETMTKRRLSCEAIVGKRKRKRMAVQCDTWRKERRV